MNAEGNTANCWKKAITIMCNILVAFVLKISTSRHNILIGSQCLRAKIKFAPVSRGSWHKPSTGLVHLK